MSGVDRGLATRRFVAPDGTIHIKLLPKEYYVTCEPWILTTVLGSCISVCLRDATAGVAGMNHFMLPESGPHSAGRLDGMAYGDQAIPRLLDALLAIGARRERLEAKIFGGGHVLADMAHARIGELNAAFARRYLAEAGIALRAEDVGGRWPRQLQYDAATGIGRVRHLGAVAPVLVEREKALMRTAADMIPTVTS